MSLLYFIVIMAVVGNIGEYLIDRRDNRR